MLIFVYDCFVWNREPVSHFWLCIVYPIPWHRVAGGIMIKISSSTSSYFLRRARASERLFVCEYREGRHYNTSFTYSLMYSDS